MTFRQLNERDAYYEILEHIRRAGGSYQSWYAGVADDARQRLFHDHQVQVQGDGWIVRICQSDATARYVKSALLRLGCDGGPRNGDIAPAEVYVYRKTGTTKP